MQILCVLLNLLTVLKICQTANILAVFPFTARSHFTMFKALLDELHDRGHNLTVVSHFPRKQLTDNYTDISLIGKTKSLNANMSLSNLAHFGLLDNLQLLNEQIDDYEPLLKVPAIINLMKSNYSFDLIITEIFNTDMFLGFYYKFKCPNVAMSASPLMPWAYSRIGLMIKPSFMPIVFSQRTYQMNFFEMAKNTFDWAISLLYYKYVMNPKSESIAKKYFGDIPPLEQLAGDTSLILVNTHLSIHPYMTSSKKLIEVGGMHIKEAKPLDNTLEQFMNQSEKGVIVFSMGSMFRAESIPKEIFNIFLNVFSKLEQNVLWKWESGKPPSIKNIKFMKWLPQRDVLAHPNVKLFIYHGGLLGTSEAIYCGVPILGFPQFGDMAQNMAAIGAAGLSLSLMTLTEESLTKAIYQLINDHRYKKSAERLSLLYKDRSEDPLTTAVYWVEYVLRHNGTNHIRQAPTDPNQLLITSSVLFFVCLLTPIIVAIVGVTYLRQPIIQIEKVKLV